MKTDWQTRSTALEHLASRIEEERATIVSLMVRELELTSQSARLREVELPSAFLRQHSCSQLERLLADPELQLASRRGLGKVAILLPYNAIGIAAAATVGAAYLTGNEVVIRLPSRAPLLSEFYRRLFTSTLPGVEVVTEQGPSFLTRCFEGAVRAICLFGDDRWFTPMGCSPAPRTPAQGGRASAGLNYRELARCSRTKVIFDGPGKDPFVVFADAQIAKAASAAVRSAYANAGQSCSSPERFFVHSSVFDEFVAEVVERTQRLRVGRPESDDTELGPIGSQAVCARLQHQFADARERGARFLTGGEIVRLDGCRSPVCLPSVVVNCTHDMLLFQEETFGPVIPVVRFESEAQVLELVNDSRYGLTATVFGGSERFREQLAHSHGRVFHDSCIVDPEHALCRLFWGGFRNSGWIWEWIGPNFMHREGPRRLIAEFSRLESIAHD